MMPRDTSRKFGTSWLIASILLAPVVALSLYLWLSRWPARIGSPSTDNLAFSVCTLVGAALSHLFSFSSLDSRCHSGGVYTFVLRLALSVRIALCWRSLWRLAMNTCHQLPPNPAFKRTQIGMASPSPSGPLNLVR